MRCIALGTGHDAVVLAAQHAGLGRAIRKQGPSNLCRLFLPPSTGQQAHARQLFLLGPVHAHQCFQIAGGLRTRMALAQKLQHALRLWGIAFLQGNIAQLCQPLWGVRRDLEHFFDILARQIQTAMHQPVVCIAQEAIGTLAGGIDCVQQSIRP